MTEKQKLLLQLFREVDAICKKHDLRYVMAGGTLIGVLRNEGFIPWTMMWTSTCPKVTGIICRNMSERDAAEPGDLLCRSGP